MTLLAAIFILLFGLAFGSFLNICISRLPAHESIVHPASRCPACRQPIRPWDNLPLLSWALLSGRCRRCGWRIPWRYPLVELIIAALFLLSFLTFGLTLEGAAMALLCFLLTGLAVMDAETLLLTNAFTVPGIALGIVYSVLRGGWWGYPSPFCMRWRRLCSSSSFAAPVCWRASRRAWGWATPNFSP